MQPTSRDPEVDAYPRLLERCCRSQARGFCRRIAGYLQRAHGGNQGRAGVHHQRPAHHLKRESSACVATPVRMNTSQSFCREGVAWKHLRHPNVLPLLGVTVTERRFAMVSEWMEHGNIVEFIRKDKHVNRTELVRRPSSSAPTGT
jgi:serine/threonine protein kinase